MAGWRESLRKRTGMTTVEIILQFSLRGKRKNEGGGWGGRRWGRKARKRVKGKWVPSPLSPIPLPFPFLPIPYPFRRLLRRLIRVCHNLIVCAVCAKILKAGNFSSIFCERFLLFSSRWLLSTDGDLLNAYSTLSSVFCKQLFIVYLTIVSLLLMATFWLLVFISQWCWLDVRDYSGLSSPYRRDQ